MTARHGFPTYPDAPSLGTLTTTLLGQPVLYQPVLLGQLGPDLTGGGFGMTFWEPGNFVGLWSVGEPFAIGSQDLVGGYVAQEGESIKAVTVFAQSSPSLSNAVINVWKKPLGGVWAATGDSVTLLMGEVFSQTATNITLTVGDALAFELDMGSSGWSLGQAACSILGLRVKE